MGDIKYNRTGQSIIGTSSLDGSLNQLPQNIGTTGDVLTVSPTGSIVWSASSGGATPSLADVLLAGNTTGDTDIIVGASHYVRNYDSTANIRFTDNIRFTNTDGVINTSAGIDENIIYHQVSDGVNSSNISLYETNINIGSSDGVNNDAAIYIAPNNYTVSIGDENYSALTYSKIDMSPTTVVVTTNGAGVEYAADYSAGFTNRSLVDKEYVDNAVSPTGTFVPYTGATGSVNIGTYSYQGGNLYLPSGLGTPSNPSISNDLVLFNSGGNLSARRGTNGYTRTWAASLTTSRTWTFPDKDGTVAMTSDVPTKGSFGITIDGGGSAITTGVKGYVEIPYSGTITGWSIVADQVGSCVIDVWKDTYANFPPTVADTIAGSEKPTLSSAQKNQDLALSTWTTSVTAGDFVGFNVDSATTVTRVQVYISITKTS